MSQKEMEIRMEDKLGVDDINIAGEKYEDIDPAIFDDPILMLQWLEGKPQRACNLPLQQDTTLSSSKQDAHANNRCNNGNTCKKAPLAPDELWIVENIIAEEDTPIVEGFDEWLSNKVSADSKCELYQAYEVIEICAYKHKLLEKDLLKTTDVPTIRRIYNLLIIQKRGFRTIDATKRYTYGLALRYYLQYLDEATG